MKNLLKTALLTVILAGAAVPAFAGTADIRAADRAVEFDVGASNLRYGESVNNATFDTENGWMPNLGLGITWLSRDDGSWTSNTYLHLDGQAAFGQTDYNGGIQGIIGNTIINLPYQTKTDDEIYTVSAKAGHMFFLAEGFSLTPYLDLGYRSWYRNVNGGPFRYNGSTYYVSSSKENYQNFQTGGGFMAQYSPLPRLVLTGSAQYGSIFSPTMTTQGVTYNLGSQEIYEIEGRVGYAITPRFELISDARFTGFGFNKSDLNYSTGAYEPDSYSHQLTVVGGIAYHLQ